MAVRDIRFGVKSGQMADGRIRSRAAKLRYRLGVDRALQQAVHVEIREYVNLRARARVEKRREPAERLGGDERSDDYRPSANRARETLKLIMPRRGYGVHIRRMLWAESLATKLCERMLPRNGASENKVRGRSQPTRAFRARQAAGLKQALLSKRIMDAERSERKTAWAYIPVSVRMIHGINADKPQVKTVSFDEMWTRVGAMRGENRQSAWIWTAFAGRAVTASVCTRWPGRLRCAAQGRSISTPARVRNTKKGEGIRRLGFSLDFGWLGYSPPSGFPLSRE